MKKRLSCVFLTLMLMFVNMAPAYAAEVSATKDFGEMLEMSDAEMAAFSADNNGSAVMAESTLPPRCFCTWCCVCHDSIPHCVC